MLPLNLLAGQSCLIIVIATGDPGFRTAFLQDYLAQPSSRTFHLNEVHGFIQTQSKESALRSHPQLYMAGAETGSIVNYTKPVSWADSNYPSHKTYSQAALEIGLICCEGSGVFLPPPFFPFPE